MISNISRKMVNRLLRKDVITREDYEIYLFGLEQLLTTIINLLTCAIIGIAFDSLLQTILFVIVFIVIRSYAGGYHTSTPLRCYVLTTLTIIVSVVALKCIEWNMWILIGLLVIASIVILLFAPVDTENKPIDAVEYVYFRNKTKVVLGVEVLLAISSMAFHFETGAESIVLALVVLAVALVCEKMKKR